MVDLQTEYDKFLELLRSILLFNPTVDPAFDPTLNPAIDPQLNKNKSELDKANFIRCLIIVTVIEKYRDKARNGLKYEKEKDVEFKNSLLKQSTFRQMLKELEDDDDEIENKIKELIHQHAHHDPNLEFFDLHIIKEISNSLADCISAAHNEPDYNPTNYNPTNYNPTNYNPTKPRPT